MTESSEPNGLVRLRGVNLAEQASGVIAVYQKVLEWSNPALESYTSAVMVQAGLDQNLLPEPQRFTWDTASGDFVEALSLAEIIKRPDKSRRTALNRMTEVPMPPTPGHALEFLGYSAQRLAYLTSAIAQERLHLPIWGASILIEDTVLRAAVLDGRFFVRKSSFG